MSATTTNAAISKTETLLAHLLCTDTAPETLRYGGERRSNTGAVAAEVDAGTWLPFDPQHPSRSYTVQLDGDTSRLYSPDPEYLLRPAQDTLGRKTEVALLTPDRVKWTCIKKLHKRPRNVWIGSPGASLYEYHYREIFESGQSLYARRVAALDRHGKPAVCVVSGSQGGGDASGAWSPSEHLILAASIVEDAHRVSALTATVTDGASIIFPVPIGDHKDLFALRDAPLTPTGRRRAILHWVAQHTKQTRTGDKPTRVSAYTRGVREFAIDGLNVRLDTN